MNPWDDVCRHYLAEAGITDPAEVDVAQRQAYEAWQRGMSLHEFAELYRLTGEAVAHDMPAMASRVLELKYRVAA